MKRLTLLLTLLLLLTACQSAPPAGTEPASDPQGIAQDADLEPVEADPLAPGSEEGSRPLHLAEEKTTVKVPETPDTASFFLTRWDGEQGMDAFCYSAEDRAAFAEALPEVQGYAVLEDRVVPKDPWPVYTLAIGGVEEDFVASYACGIWRDNQGNVLRADLDFDGLWERFGKTAKRTRESGEFAFPSSRPINRELSLRGGNWDARFLHKAEIQEPDPLVPMELDTSGNGLNWTIVNQSGHNISTGNDRSAVPQVQIADTWYDVPILSGKNYVCTLEGYGFQPGADFEGSLWQEPYGPLPDGNYRLVLEFSWWNEPRSDNLNEVKRNDGIAAAEFSIQNGKFVTEA